MYHQAVFKQESVSEKGTYLKVFIPESFIRNEFFINGVANGQIRIDDGRAISGSQRGMLYMLFTDIAKQSDHHYEEIKELLKLDFARKRDIPYFSLSNVDMTTARLFTEFVLDFAFEHDIELSVKTFQQSKFISNWSYLCFKNRECVLCRRKEAQAHHIESVGAGRNRTKLDHSTMPLMMLCAKHHKEIHNIGNKTFMAKYHVTGIYVDVATLKALNIKGKYGQEVDNFIQEAGGETNEVT